MGRALKPFRDKVLICDPTSGQGGQHPSSRLHNAGQRAIKEGSGIGNPFFFQRQGDGRALRRLPEIEQEDGSFTMDYEKCDDMLRHAYELGVNDRRPLC